MSLDCSWMNIPLDSPIIIASLTPTSNLRIKEHVHFYHNAVMNGAGCIILPSINPSKHGNENENPEIVDTHIIKTGIGKKDSMAFSVLGPTDPNIISIEYGINLIRAIKKEKLNKPIIASLAIIGKEKDYSEAIKKLQDIGVDGFEINFSCPNVETLKGNHNTSIKKIIRLINRKTKKPISIKISPYYDYRKILNGLKGKINSITIANAHLGLVPPSTQQKNEYSPFHKTNEWAPTGIYGPFEKPLTYYLLYQYSKLAKQLKVDISCVGGLITGDDIIQALLLGATVVEISSGIQWFGTNIFNIMNQSLEEYMKKMGFNHIAELKGLALKSIKENADAVKKDIKQMKAIIDVSLCKQCSECLCINRLCLAISKCKSRIQINKELCNGCGWCINTCKNNAIRFE